LLTKVNPFVTYTIKLTLSSFCVSNTKYRCHIKRKPYIPSNLHGYVSSGSLSNPSIDFGGLINEDVLLARRFEDSSKAY